jgi:hypothetical protein
VRHYLGVVGLAEALGVSRHVVHKWRGRHPAGSGLPFPEPDVEVDGAPGWEECRVYDVRRWREGLPGQGAGGGRPTASRVRYLEAAAARGFDREEALRTLGAFGNSFPEMSEPEIEAWLLREWGA